VTTRDSRKDRLGTVIERWVDALSRLPPWLAPVALWASVGAALLFFMTVFRGVFLLFAAPAHPKVLLEFLAALVVTTTAGALAGAAFPLMRVPLRHLGFVGDLLTGPLLGCVYIFVILIPAKYLFHDDGLQTRADWLSAAAIGGGFGLVGTILYWYESWRRKTGR